MSLYYAQKERKIVSIVRLPALGRFSAIKDHCTLINMSEKRIAFELILLTSLTLKARAKREIRKCELSGSRARSRRADCCFPHIIGSKLNIPLFPVDSGRRGELMK